VSGIFQFSSAIYAKLRALDESRNFSAAQRWLRRFKEERLAQSEIDAVAPLLSSKPRPVGWSRKAKTAREVGVVWPVADDVEFTAVDINGWRRYSVDPGSFLLACLIVFHGGGLLFRFQSRAIVVW